MVSFIVGGGGCGWELITFFVNYCQTGNIGIFQQLQIMIRDVLKVDRSVRAS